VVCAYRAVKMLPVVTAIVLATGCGKSNPGSPSPTPSVQTEAGTVQGPGFFQYDFNPTQSGSSTITVTWSNSSVDLDLFVTDANCANATALLNGGCVILNRSEANVGITTERVQRSVATSDRLRVWIVNFSTVAQGFTITFEIR
jgi:hypothetical protein